MSDAEGRQMIAEAAWYRSEHDRKARELDALTPERVAAYGEYYVRRLHVDHDLFLQLAEELEAHLVARYPHLVDQVVEDGPGLF